MGNVKMKCDTSLDVIENWINSESLDYDSIKLQCNSCENSPSGVMFTCYAREQENTEREAEKCNLASIKDWRPLPTRNDNWDDYNIAAENNCYLKFEDGSVCRYNDHHWPMAITTHYAHAE